MSSTADDRNKSARRRKGPFQDDTESGSDTDIPSRSKTSTRANRDEVEELDFFGESIEASIKDMLNENHVLDNAGQTACLSQPATSAGMFVENTDGKSDVALPHSEEIKVKSEPDSEDEIELMIIDRADASSNAQERWSIPRPPIVIDLATVKEEPLANNESMLQHSESQSSLQSLEERKKEIETKALKGALTSDDLQEMMRLMAQLSQAAKAPTAITLTDPTQHEQAPGQESKKRQKRKRNAPAADAAEYWARREKKEQERNEKSRARRGGQAKDSNSDDSDLEEKNYLQIDKMLEPFDAIQHRADQGDLPAAPTITATRTNDQLKEMLEAAKAAPEYLDRKILNEQKQELKQATQAWGSRAVRGKNGKWEVRGLLTPLLTYQLIMGAWMMGRELRATSHLPRGGILADAMGLGKTLETLSCIVGNQASESRKDAGMGATLVICPSGQMISQWMSEVKKHCHKRFSRSIVRFKAGDKTDVDTLSAYNIVMVERCFREELNRDMESGVAVRQIRSYLVMLLRLRQAATHPFLLEGMMRDHFSLEDLQVTKEKLKALKGGPTVYSQIGPWTQRQKIQDKRFQRVFQEIQRVKQRRLEDARKESLEAMKVRRGEYDQQDVAQTSNSQDTAITGNDAFVINDRDEVDSQDDEEEDEDGMVPTRPRSPSIGSEVELDSTAPTAEDEPQLDPFGRSDFGLNFDMTKQIEYLERLKELETAACVLCKAAPPKEPVRGRCGCNFCDRCVMAHLAYKSRNCPECRRIIGTPKPLQAFNGDETDEELQNENSMLDKSVNEKGYTRGFDYNKFQQTENVRKNKKPNRFLQISDKRPNVPLTPSAKMTALKETVLRWQSEAPDDKIVIFSQFTAVMKIIGRILESEGICFAYLSGKQSTEQRNKAVHEFQNGKEVKVLIASLRAGGQCLNLERGNRVILIELWWNHAVEQQAFARVYRLGQSKETHFVRFIVNTPIESRILEMQVEKILDIDEALQDEAVRAPKIGLKDIASLLGRVTTRADGVMHIEPDDYDDEYYDNDVPGNEEDESDLDDLVVPDDVVEYEDDEDDEENGVISDDE
ncbi:hypothetical protein LZ31DRAFT_599029 [Colletotrichum somersetense]|nr:hypothetical protein LZ31DRAFT_599029 [Colletotrichum somersetense]